MWRSRNQWMFGLFIKICLIDEDETITECILRLFQNGVKAPWKNEGRSCCSSTFISTVWNKPADTCNSLNTVQSRQIPTTSALWLHAWCQCVWYSILNHRAPAGWVCSPHNAGSCSACVECSRSTQMPVAKPHYLNVNGSSEDGMDVTRGARGRGAENWTVQV